MSAKVLAHPSAGPAAAWPGHAVIDGTGARIALDMLTEMQSTDADGNSVGDEASITNWHREGRPHRNMVAECAAKAQSAGPEAIAAFYAVLGDYIGCCLGGCTPDIEGYERFCGRD